ncbi:MAG: ATPase, T2SS/T4P/T4SS family [Planctomycetota bacterium]
MEAHDAPKRLRLGEALISQGLLTERQLQIALEEQKQAHRPLGEMLVSLGFVRPRDIAALVAEELGLPLVDGRAVRPDADLIAALDEGLVRSTKALPVERVAGGLRVLMVDPSDPAKLSTLRQYFHCDIEVELITDEDFSRLVRECFSGRDSTAVTESIESRPVEQVTETIVVDAIRRGATDLHLHPEESCTRVRYRVDGVLRQAEVLPRRITGAVTSRIKILANLDISERRLPQDGRFRIPVDGRQVDLRVSTMPTAHGESVVLRVPTAAAAVAPPPRTRPGARRL